MAALDVDFEVMEFAGITGGVFPRVEAYTVPGGRGQVPTAVAVFLCAGIADDTTRTTQITSVGFFGQFTGQRAVAVMAEDGAATGAADAGYRVDNATVVQKTTDSGFALDCEAECSVGVDEVRLNWSGGTNARGFMLVFFGATVLSDVQDVVSNAALGGTVDVAMGFLPDAVLLCSVDQAFVADGGGFGHVFSFGFAARSPSANQACIASTVENKAAGTTSVGSIVRDDSSLTFLSSSGGVVTEGTRLSVSFPGSTGYRVTTNNLAGAHSFMSLALYLGGSACWAGVEIIPTNTTGLKAITTPGIKPKALVIGGIRQGAVNSLLATQASFSLGAGTERPSGTLQEAQISGRARDNVATSETFSHESNHVVTVLDQAGHDWQGDLVSFDRNTPPTTPGFTINVLDASAAGRATAILVLGDARESRAFETKGMRVRRVPSKQETRMRVPGTRPRGASDVREKAFSAQRPTGRVREVRAPTGQVVRASAWFWKAITRFRLQRLIRMRFRPEPELPTEFPAAVTEATSSRGSNALAGSADGDNAMAGSQRGSRG